jgi:hypothetical protein
VSSVEELEQRLEILEARLRGVEDIEAIRRLKARYGQLADRRYARKGPGGPHGVKPREELEPIARELASLFSEDAVWDGGKSLGLCKGREAIYQRFLAPTLHFSWHYFVKPQIQIDPLDGDRAKATWDILAACTTTKDVACWMAGLEKDEYVRVDGQWLHSAMELEVSFMAPYELGWARRSATG